MDPKMSCLNFEDWYNLMFYVKNFFVFFSFVSIYLN